MPTTVESEGVCVKAGVNFDCDGNYLGSVDDIPDQGSCATTEFKLKNQCINRTCWVNLKKLDKNGPSSLVTGSVNPALWYEVTKGDTSLEVKIHSQEDLESSGCLQAVVYQTSGNLKDQTRMYLDAN